MINHRGDLGSSMLAAGAYDDRKQVLYLQFNAKGNTPARFYSYAGVPRAVWTGLLAASSRGKFFLNSVKGSYAALEIPAEHWQQVLDALPEHVLTIDWSLAVPVLEFA